MDYLFDFRRGRGAIALLLLRLVVGWAFVLHGWMKIQSPGRWCGWMGEAIPAPWQGLAVIAEFGGGLALIVGLLTPLACFGIICTMGVAIQMVLLPKGAKFVQMPGPTYELCAVYIVAALAIMLCGPGWLSLDALIFGRAKVTPPPVRE